MGIKSILVASRFVGWFTVASIVIDWALGVSAYEDIKIESFAKEKLQEELIQLEEDTLFDLDTFNMLLAPYDDEGI